MDLVCVCVCSLLMEVCERVCVNVCLRYPTVKMYCVSLPFGCVCISGFDQDPVYTSAHMLVPVCA